MRVLFVALLVTALAVEFSHGQTTAPTPTALGEACTEDGDCGENTACNTNCECATNYASYDGTHCRSDIGQACTDVDDCGDETTCTGSVCACSTGYSQITGEANCEDVDECTAETDDCIDTADCNNTPGSFSCTCKEGYTGSGAVCNDINECELGTHECDEHATCTNTAGSYTCACSHLYDDTYGDGTKCDTKDNTCEIDGYHTCSNGGTCVEFYEPTTTAALPTTNEDTTIA